MYSQITDTLMMIRPVAFHRNEQTAVNNYYQKHLAGLSNTDIQQRALEEFDAFVNRLQEAGVEVLVIGDTPKPEKPDSIFPNNWISMHEDGSVILYPMFAPNRRVERREDILEQLTGQFQVQTISELTEWEAQGKFLEGTGSLILDRLHRVAYAAISERTHPEVLHAFGVQYGYDVVSFHAFQSVNGQRLPIYHTNVMMCLGEQFAVLCAQSVDDERERQQLIRALEQSGREVIQITEAQKEHFAGNMLQVKNNKGNRLIVMSSAAHSVLTETQVEALGRHGRLLHSSLDTIEALGGGSARCMMAEVFLPRK